jgi:ribosomal protein S18 acetylase RimI-like enzyme
MTSPPTPNQPTVACTDPLTDQDALALAAGAWPEAEAAGYARLVNEALAAGQAEQVVLAACRDERGLIASQAALVLPGRTALVWLPQAAGERSNVPNPRTTAERMFSAVVTALGERGVHLAQSLAAVGDIQAEELFALGGFSRGAELLYLTAEARTFPHQPPELPFELAQVDANDGRRLAEVLDKTYRGTLDCPQLDALRETDDVIAGYRAVGECRQELWQIVRDQNRDVGCLLINVHPEVNHAELVYLGLAPHVRGRGWGLALVRQALWVARQLAVERLVLAVDAANWPAIGVYRQAGFEPFDRRTVWYRAISGSKHKS